MNRVELAGESVFLIREFLSPEECERAVAFSEGHGYDEAPITTRSGFEMRKDIRNNTLAMVDDPALAGRLFERSRLFLPERMGDRRLLGLNERFRYYRYDLGQTFRPHYDGSFARSVTEESELTFMVYLNDGFEGGETRFFDPVGTLRVAVRPDRGAALVFVNRQLHEGAVVDSGRKYVLRTDVMYRREVRP